MTVSVPQPLFLAVGKHGPVDPADGHRIGAASLAWLEQQLASGVFEAVYSMDGGGRVILARAADAGSLSALLNAAPDVERDWQINRLRDGLEVIRRYLADSDNSVA